jgi:hypothetical protein
MHGRGVLAEHLAVWGLLVLTDWSHARPLFGRGLRSDRRPWAVWSFVPLHDVWSSHWSCQCGHFWSVCQVLFVTHGFMGSNQNVSATAHSEESQCANGRGGQGANWGTSSNLASVRASMPDSASLVSAFSGGGSTIQG